MDSLGKKAGKGALIQEEVSATLGVSQDQTLFQPVTIATLEGNGTRESHHGDGFSEEDVAYTLNSVERHAVAYAFEPGIQARLGHHVYENVSGTLRAKAGDNQMAVVFARRTSEVRIQEKNVSPTLESAMGTGGGNAPMVAYGIDRYNQAVMEEISPTLKTASGGDDIHCVAIENHPSDSRVGIDESGKVQTLTSRCGTGGGNVPLVMIDKEQCCEENNGDIQRHRGV